MLPSQCAVLTHFSLVTHALLVIVTDSE